MSEFDLIRRLTAAAPTARDDVIIGPGDDGAVLAVPEGHELILTTDTLVAGRHFPEDTPAADIGWKAVAVNLSDLAAMGAEPGWLTVAMTVPNDDQAWLSEFVRGLSEALVAHDAVLVGGDLTRGPLTLSVQAAGTLPAGTALRRDGAQPGDAVAVTGTLGDAALALRRWPCAIETDDEHALRARLTRPEPRLLMGRSLRGLAHAAIDLSDGLLADLGHITEASGVGAVIQADVLPTSPAFDTLCPHEQQQGYQLTGGDDYELCVTGPPNALAAMLGLHIIGHIDTGEGVRAVNAHGENVDTARSGYNHFD